jgi:superfamily I DNA/RNA helicase
MQPRRKKMALISPPLEDLARLPTPLNIGEKIVLNALLELDDTWRVYVQPVLLTDNPDFVVVHDLHGICVIEVKNWENGCYRQEADGAVWMHDHRGWQRTSENPRSQASRYRRNIFENFFATTRTPNRQLPMVRGVVVLPQYTDHQSRQILPYSRDDAETRITLWGRNGLEGRLMEMLTGYQYPQGWPNGVPSESMARLEFQLAEPEVVARQRRPLELSQAAKNLARNPNNARTRRARGPAGCGKSLGLAARAAQLAASGRHVLVLCFNITLPHYLHDLSARHGRSLGAKIRNITFTHFHGFCSHIISLGAEAGVAECARIRLNQANGLQPLDELIRLVSKTYDAKANKQYDAILVDEGQDFLREWWIFLRDKVISPGGEMLLVADTTQDIYGRARWTEESSMRQCGFSGKWTELEGSYRMPPDLLPIIAEFAEAFLDDGAYDPPTLPTDHPLRSEAYEPTIRRWINVDPFQVGEATADEVQHLLNNEGFLPADVAFLCELHAEGLVAVNSLAQAGIHTSHVFTVQDNDERRRLKHRFWGGAAGVKGSTVHSFKGWEAKGVVLCIHNNRESIRLAYVALTRVKATRGAAAAVSVINANGRLRSFSDRFRREISSLEVPELRGQRRLF